MSVTYLTTPIVEVRHDLPQPGSGMTREGYTKRSGAPTSLMVRLQGERRWRRLMVWQFSNTGTLFVRLDGKPHVVREEDLPKEGVGSQSPSAHATKKPPTRPSYDTSTGAGQKRLMQESVGLEYVAPRRIEATPGDYGADPLGPDEDAVFRWRMVPSGDIVDKAEHDRRLARGAGGRHHATKKSPAQLQREIDEALGVTSHSTRRKGRIAAPRIVHVEAKTPAGYRWLKINARGATMTPEGFAVTNEHEWAQSLAAADAVEIK